MAKYRGKSLAEIESLFKWLPKDYKNIRHKNSGRPSKKKLFSQVNLINESDCEILRIQRKKYLAMTTDSIGEEVEIGLYQSPETIGWMTAAASLSDLAAVGAQPLGVILSCNWATSHSLKYKKLFARGFWNATKSANAEWYGGDVGTSKSPVFTSTGLGIIDKEPIFRNKIEPGDFLVLYRSSKKEKPNQGYFGLGPALGFDFLLNKNQKRFINENMFRPWPDFKILKKMVPFIKSGIDTSDGLIPTLNILSKINAVQFEVYTDNIVFDKTALRFCTHYGISKFCLLWGEHGDYQQIFAIKKKHLHMFKERNGFFLIARAQNQTNQSQLVLDCSANKKKKRNIDIDLGWLENKPKSNVNDYRKLLKEINLFCLHHDLR